jgi:pyruvate dehydrogenase E1 component
VDTPSAKIFTGDSDILERDAVLQRVDDRVLWLATAMIDHANRVRPNPTGLKVGGHQASSASMISIMTSLWLEQLQSHDRVSVKPHASPVLHAINYLLGDLDASFMTTLREFGGLQSYPSRSKDPDQVDYSTGSVGLGATAPAWGAIARRYINAHFSDAGLGRQYALIGDAELDEGACWEAVVDPMVAELGELVWIVDLNRQSLDRVIPDLRIKRFEGMFAAAGWQVITVKYGSLLAEAFARPGGEVLRNRIDNMGNAEFQRLLRCDAPALRTRLPGEGPGAQAIRDLLVEFEDVGVYQLIRNLGGHDHSSLRAAYAAIDDSRPTVVFAYTIKGFGLSTEGHPQNHSALLDERQLAELALLVGADANRPWQAFHAGSPEAELFASAAQRLRREPRDKVLPAPVPSDLGSVPKGVKTTQAALGRTLLELNRAAPEVGARIVTVSPDVSSSTNLGGWVNKVGVWSQSDRTDWFEDDAETILHWRERPDGRHIELGIAEVNLVGVLGELGTTWSRWGQPLLPIGVVYDPFVERALEPWSFGIYAGGQSVLVGTPSGVTLAPEGGAHQSIKTPSIGIEQPGCVYFEPAFVVDAEWILLSVLGNVGLSGGQSAYVRMSTRPVDQGLAALPVDAAARERRRRNVVAGAYTLRRTDKPAVTICAMGAMIPEALLASERLASLGFPADVVCVTSPDLLFRAVQARRGLAHEDSWILDSVLPRVSAAPMVTLLDGHPHTLAFLAGVHSVPSVHLGITAFGQSGDLDSTYRYHQVDVHSVVGAALDLID